MPPTVSEANNKLMAENRKYIEIDDHDGDDDDLRRLLCNSQLTPVCGFLKTRSRSAGADVSVGGCCSWSLVKEINVNRQIKGVCRVTQKERRILNQTSS